MLKRLFKHRKPADYSPDLWMHEYKQMAGSLTEGYGKTGVKWGSKDWEYLHQLKYNTAVFDAFKNNKQIKEAAKLLLNDDGTAKTWEEFRRDAMRVCEKYNQRWLQTEYNMAHASAKAARKWHDYLATSDLYPNLKYIAVQDERTRASHAALDGYVIPITHGFWRKYYPPNDWNCRCSVQPTDEAVKMPPWIPAVPDMFQNNVGITAQIFDTSHPFYKGLSAIEKDNLHRFVRQHIGTAEDVMKAWNEFDGMSDDWKRNYWNGDNGGYLVTARERKESAGINKNEQAKFEKEYSMSSVFAQHGYRISLLPEKPGISSPDILINGLKGDLKRVSSPNNVVKYARKAVDKQGADIVLFQIDKMSEQMHNELNVLKRRKIKALYFVTGENRIHAL